MEYESNQPKRWPVSVEPMVKGDSVSIAEMEVLFGLARADIRYPFRVLSLKGYVERELERLERDWTVAQVKGDLRILTDSEATTYHDKGVSRSIGGIYHHHIGLNNVDGRNITEVEKKFLDRAIHRAASAITALITAKVMMPTPRPHVRNLPTINAVAGE